MAKAVCHVSKGTASGGGGLGNHIDREKGFEHTYKSADPAKLHLNTSFKVNDYCSMPMEQAVSKRIEDAYTGKRAVRKDAVKHINHMLTGSHDRMHEIFRDKELAEKWVKANYEFIDENFGKENIVRFTLHLDERTPHIHCVTVPITDKGGLSAKEVMGNRVKLQQLQTKYAEKMKPFGLERGVANPNIKHQDTKEFYKDMREELTHREVERTEHTQKISELKIEEQQLQSTIGSLKTKDVLVNIFQPKKKLKNTEDELKDALKSLADAEKDKNTLLQKVQSLNNATIMLNNQNKDLSENLGQKTKELTEEKKKVPRIAHNVVGIVNDILKELKIEPRFYVKGNGINCAKNEEQLQKIKQQNEIKPPKNRGMKM